jgi:hypothetical protein
MTSIKYIYIYMCVCDIQEEKKNIIVRDPFFDFSGVFFLDRFVIYLTDTTKLIDDKTTH